MTDDELPRALLGHAGVPDDGRLVARHGWSNRAWIGADVVVRVSSGRLRRSLDHEAAVCRGLGDAGFAVPEPVAHGLVRDVDDDVDPQAEWLISRRLPGETLADAWPDLGPGQRRTAGEDLGRFLRSLHRDADLTLAPPWWVEAHEPSGYHNAYRPHVGIAVDMAHGAASLPFADQGMLDKVAALLDERLHCFADDEMVFTHGDVHGHNLLLDPATGRLTGVLDWEGAHPAAPDLELDMFLRWTQAAHHFPASPGGPPRITEGDVLELVTHVANSYPELFAHPHLQERLVFHEVQWHLVQLFFEAWWVGLGRGDPTVPSPSWAELRALVESVA